MAQKVPFSRTALCRHHQRADAFHVLEVDVLQENGLSF
jgi:hypothetical protein